MPLIATSHSNLKEDLRKLINDSALRKQIGKTARLFVEQEHDADKIAKYLVEKIY